MSPRARKATKEQNRLTDDVDVNHNAWTSWIVLLASLIGALFGGYQWLTACDRDCRAEQLLLASQVVPVVRGMPPYVPRPLIEATLAAAIGHLDQALFCSRLQTRDDVYRAIFAELGSQLTDEFPDFGIGVVTRLFQRVAALHLQRHPDAVDWVPTVIAEVRTGGEDDDRGVTKAIATALKALNTDRRSCRVILVLSDADAAFGLPMDEDRQELVWIEDFTNEQALLRGAC